MKKSLTLAACLWCTFVALAQQPYRFRATDYTRLTDRVQASQISYDTEANTFTITATGQNNVAFGMDKSHDGEWYILPSQQYLAIEGQNLSTGTGQSYIWWFNGFNNAGSAAPDHALTQADGTALLVWNLATASAINGKLDWQASRIILTSGGATLNQAIGLTSTSSQGATVTDIAFYSKQMLAATHPAMLQPLGYSSFEAIVGEAKDGLKQAMDDAAGLIHAADFNAALEEGQALQAAYAQAAALYEAEQTDAASIQAINDQTDTLAKAVSAYNLSQPVTSWQTTPTGFEAKWNDMTTTVMLYDDLTVRVYKSLTTKPEDKRSLPVVLPMPGSAYCHVTEQEGVVTLISSHVYVTYNLKTAAVSVNRTDGTPVLWEAAYGTTFTPKKDGESDSYQAEQRFVLDPDEAIYGLGQIQNGSLNQRGKDVTLEQDNMKVCIPYWQSSRNYGFYWDIYSPTTFTDTPQQTSLSSTATEIDYYVLVASDAQGVLPLMRNLTGHSPMVPLWNFGLYQSKERYTSSDEVREVLRKYRELQVPLDCMVQDWQYWGEDNNNWNALAFENPKYSDGEQMIQDIHDQNAKLMISIWANFGPNTRPYKELQGMGRLMDVGKDGTWPRGFGVKPYDAYSPEARDVYWCYLYEGLVSKGVDAYWMDSSEPDYYHGHSREYDFDYVSAEGRTWRSLRNAFPLAHVGGAYDHHRAQQATDPVLAGKRVAILTRSAYAGQQRYGANTWSGDVTASWQNFAAQIPAACNLSACGIPYWNSDTGGFFRGTFGGVGDAAWRNLYLRWTQFSCFSPMMRFHGTDTPREIYQFGLPGDGDFEQILKYIRLRYRLIPYLYSTARRVMVDDATFMQALPIAFELPRAYADITDEYMFGSAFLVCPIVQPGVNGRDVYLPQAQWVDFWTGQPIAGGQTIRWTGAADRFPLYVKAGSILPWGPDVQYAGEKPWDELEMRVYPGADGQFTLYEDAGDGYGYEQGECSEIPFSWDEQTQTLTIGPRRGQFPGMMEKRTFRLCKVSPLCAAGDRHATVWNAEVEYDGSELKVQLAEQDEAEQVEDITAQYIQNPSFEQDGRTLTQQAPQGWTVDSNCQWWGVNLGGGNGDPAATDGQYLFGVWDKSTTARATIKQTITLPAGQYRLTVDMHASNRVGQNRLGSQRVFAGEAEGRFAEQVLNNGTGDTFPLQTIAVDFAMDEESPIEIGVTTSDAPIETWYKVDNFRLFRITRPAHQETSIQIPSPTASTHRTAATYSIDGCRIAQPAHHGIYIRDGRKVVVK